MSVEDVESGNEEFVGVLLLVPRQVSGVGPDEMQQSVRNVHGADPRIELQSVEMRTIHVHFMFPALKRTFRDTTVI